MLNLRNTPVPGIGSPAQRMFGRRTKTLMPTSDVLLKPETQKPDIVKQKLTDRRNQSKQLYDTHAREMQPLVIGDTVRVRDRGNNNNNNIYLKSNIHSITRYKFSRLYKKHGIHNLAVQCILKYQEKASI